MKAFILMLSLILTGCSSYGTQTYSMLELVRQGNLEQADATAITLLDPEGNDQLLHYLERGMIAHLDQRYDDSNQLLEQALLIAEALYRTPLDSLLMEAVSHPGNGVYKGQVYERSFLHYTKMLNYLMLAQQADQLRDRARLLDGARVENRRLQLFLENHVRETGDYQDAAEEQSSVSGQFARFFRLIMGEYFIADELLFRDEAFAHYVMGAMYEQYGELDNARISYQTAAELYEAGYQSQYALPARITRQAWRDVIRVMQKAGGYDQRWPELVRDKLAGETVHWSPEQGELLILQHTGMLPSPEVLNIHMLINDHSRQLVLRPVPLALGGQDMREQWLWFHILYADKGIYNLIRDIYDGSIFSTEGVLFNSQATTLKPVWDEIEKAELDQSLGHPGVRIAVPYYPLPRRTVTSGWLEVLTSSDKQTTSKAPELCYGGYDTADDGAFPVLKGDSVAHLAFLQSVTQARARLYSAMIRETVRNAVTHAALKDLGQWGTIGGKLLTAGTTHADTRSWLTLPDHIRISRISLPEGEHRVRLTTCLFDGQKTEQEFSVTSVAGQLTLLNVRTFLPKTTGRAPLSAPYGGFQGARNDKSITKP